MPLVLVNSELDHSSASKTFPQKFFYKYVGIAHDQVTKSARLLPGYELG